MYHAEILAFLEKWWEIGLWPAVILHSGLKLIIHVHAVVEEACKKVGG